MSMTPPDADRDDEIDGRAIDHVLGVTSIFERRAAEARLATDPAFRAAVDHWQAVLSPLDEETAPVAPSPRLWSAIAAEIEPAPPLAMAAKTAAPPEAPAGIPARTLIIGGAVLVLAAAVALMI